MLGHYGFVLTPPAQNAAVNFGVQGFHPTIHHFREAGVVGDLHSRDARLRQQSIGSSGGQYLDVQGMK